MFCIKLSTHIYTRSICLSADKGSEGFIYMRDSRLLVDYHGQVKWAIPMMIKSSCTVNVRYFPFDNQHCFIRFGSWIYEESQLDVVLNQQEVDLSSFGKNSELDLTSTSLEREVLRYDMLPGSYPQVTLYLNLRRRPLYYAYTVLAPTLVLCILTLFSFQLPCDNGDKVGIGLTVFLSLYVLQLSIAEHIPESNSLPLIGKTARENCVHIQLYYLADIASIEIYTKHTSM